MTHSATLQSKTVIITHVLNELNDATLTTTFSYALPYYQCSKALSTLSQKSATVAENGETTATVSLFCDSMDRL